MVLIHRIASLVMEGLISGFTWALGSVAALFLLGLVVV